MEDYRDFSPAAIPSNEVRRLEAVRKTGVMDVANEELFLIYTELAKEISNMPVSYTGLIDEERQYMLCHVGLSKDRPDSAPREKTFCQFALNSTDPILVEDCSKDERFKNHPVVTGDPYVKFYGGFPLVTQGGLILGTLCVVDTELGKKLDNNQITLIQKLAARLAHQLETQGDQREITASRTIDMLKVIVKNYPDMTIKDTINFLTIIEGRPIDEEGKQKLIKCDLLDASGVMTRRGREFQSELDLDQGIFKRISISKDQAEANLDSMLSELGDI
ncbi:MAG: GAF domain-containing protein [Paracoccaceae bacterium]|nr:MAG: GAF domain-containing protein [Alphaproteobacteria bacterium]